MGYAGYVPAKIAQFEFTPLEQARATLAVPRAFAGSMRRALQPRPEPPRGRGKLAPSGAMQLHTADARGSAAPR